MADITLIPLAPEDQEQFILDNQEAFNYGALEEFGRRNEEFESRLFPRTRSISQSTSVTQPGVRWKRCTLR